MAAAIPQETRLLECICHHRDAGPSNAHHLGYEFLGQLQIVAALQIAAAQEPARQPRHDCVARVAGGRLLRYRRGHIRIIDLGGLQETACECYQSVKTQAERLLKEG